MSFPEERSYARASQLASALDEELLYRADPIRAGQRPQGGLSWAEHGDHLASLLEALAWAVAPDPAHRPQPTLLEQLPATLVVDLRDRQNDGETVAERLTQAARELRDEQPLREVELLSDIARLAEGEASEALRRIITP